MSVLLVATPMIIFLYAFVFAVLHMNSGGWKRLTTDNGSCFFRLGSAPYMCCSGSASAQSISLA